MRWLLLLAVSGCSFSVPPGEGAVETDGGVGSGSDADIEISARRCDMGDSSLRLCIDFDGPVQATSDGSGRGHDADGKNLTMTTRNLENAALLASNSSVHVAETPDLDIPDALTMSMWMQIDQESLPESSTVGSWLLDNNQQYFMSVREDGALRCGIGPTPLDTPAGVVGELDEDWHHVGCTFDGTLLSIYVDGSRVRCNRYAPRAIPVVGTDGLAIGANLSVGPAFKESYVGGLDNVQVFARSKTPAEMCSSAGHSGCEDQCLL